MAGPTWASLLDVLRPKGRYAVSDTLYLKDLSFLGCTVLKKEVFPARFQRIELGEVAPVVAATYPLVKIAEAQEAFQRKGHVGKIVLTVD